MYKLNKKYRKLKAKYSSIEDDLSVSRALLEAKVINTWLHTVNAA